ncbi:methyltransferase-like protein 25B [Malaya genurostris]|uniref:methyltransferase-like protein 25B n=1 Tax=Malaya genurostris TaxID=325434 RepID=UPI0026F3FE17|nr:methyltransferase-like protein 25B [Malaya genurostris]
MLKFDEHFKFGEYFTNCSKFLCQYKWIFEHSNTKFVQAGILDQLPKSWIRDLKSATTKELNLIPSGYVNENWSSDFKLFLSTVASLVVSYDEVDYSTAKQPLLKGLSPKKQYEIENLTVVIEEMCCESEILLDFGSGLGYLSQNLHLKKKFTVLGIDGDSFRVGASQKRQSKLFTNSTDNVKFVHHFIDENSFEYLNATVSLLFPQQSDTKFMIVGLHACADLSPTAIKMFLSNESITKIAIMPCCYHKLRVSGDSCNIFENIPLSNQLRRSLEKDKNFLCRPFLRLGCQQTSARWKLLTQDQHDSHGKAMFERSLVEAVLDEGQFVTAKKIRSTQFTENAYTNYYLRHNSNPTSNCPWTDHHIKRYNELLTQNPAGAQFAEYLTCLQTCLQPLCENIILLDRLCYIHEEASKQHILMRISMVKLSDDKLSPRCFIIKAEKEYDSKS